MKNINEIEDILHSTYGKTAYTEPINRALAYRVFSLMLLYKTFDGTNPAALTREIKNELWEDYSGGTTAEAAANKILEGFFD